LTRGSDFWSRRKARVAAEEAAEARAKEASEAAEHDAASAQKSDEELLEELDLPDPDSLQPGDDVRGFMAQAVPDRLRRRALRKLWLTNPALANLDGLIDYGEDFTDGATVIENLQTTYQVGRGMVRHVEEMARSEAQDPEPESDPGGRADDGEKVADTAEVTEPDAVVYPAAAETTEGVAPAAAFADQGDVGPADGFPRRRMRFNFETRGEESTA
jgi:hypothetical protein